MRLIPSRALVQFNESVKSAESLLDLEKTYNDPPTEAEQSIVQGLRGGAIILLMASFENFLKTMIEEQLSTLIIKSDKCPSKMCDTNISHTLKPVLKCSPFNRNYYQSNLNIQKACTLVLSGNINPKAFCITDGNPNSTVLNKLFLNMGIKNLFRDIKGGFDCKWPKREIDSFIPEKLDEIVIKRNNVAHAADALNISREDLIVYFKFIKMMTILLESTLKNFVDNLNSK